MQAKDLLILGTGCHAIEMADMVDRINAHRSTWNLLGHLSLAGDPVPEHCGGRPVVGTGNDLERFDDARLVCDNTWKELSPIPDSRLASLVDPSSVISSTATVGPGCVIYPQAFIGHNTQLGRRVFMLAGSVINHDNVLEDNVIVCSHVSLAGYVHVEADSYLGQACTVRQGIRIGRNSLIGMGSVLIKDVQPDSVMIGSPARRLRSRSD